MDLLLKQVLQTKNVSSKAHARDKTRTYLYVESGKNFLTHKPLRHEEIFLSPYYSAPQIQILFKHLIAMGFQNSGGVKDYIQKRILSSPNMEGLFETGFFKRLFGILNRTQKAHELRTEILKTLEQLESTLPELIHSDQEKALKILLSIGGNIFLLKNLDFDLLNQIDNQLIKEFKRQYNYDSGCSGCGPWLYFDDYGDTFDSDFDSADTSFGDSSWSGCSSCSGCSGCSGCGGCGD